ncbi:hypothetical protein MYX06_00130 [Patescibacteria group bacterium AH-259-L05]|nr:hypothetical protein [Patescibacteria group bacterium AH-259-L05]
MDFSQILALDGLIIILTGVLIARRGWIKESRRGTAYGVAVMAGGILFSVVSSAMQRMWLGSILEVLLFLWAVWVVIKISEVKDLKKLHAG